MENTRARLRALYGDRASLAVAAVEVRLDPQRFARHRSTIVNVDRIRELQPSFHREYVVVLRDGTRLHCSRTYADRLDRTLGG